MVSYGQGVDALRVSGARNGVKRRATKSNGFSCEVPATARRNRKERSEVVPEQKLNAL